MVRIETAYKNVRMREQKFERESGFKSSSPGGSEFPLEHRKTHLHIGLNCDIDCADIKILLSDIIVTYSSIVIGIREMHWCLSQSYYKGIVQSSLFSFDLIVHFAYIGHRFQQLGTVLEKKNTTILQCHL